MCVCETVFTFLCYPDCSFNYEDKDGVYDLGVILLEIIVGRAIISENDCSIAKDLVSVPPKRELIAYSVLLLIFLLILELLLVFPSVELFLKFEFIFVSFLASSKHSYRLHSSKEYCRSSSSQGML